jgi:hypothetical protein
VNLRILVNNIEKSSPLEEMLASTLCGPEGYCDEV